MRGGGGGGGGGAPARGPRVLCPLLLLLPPRQLLHPPHLQVSQVQALPLVAGGSPVVGLHPGSAAPAAEIEEGKTKGRGGAGRGGAG
jgi:hypothetical protein